MSHMSNQGWIFTLCPTQSTKNEVRVGVGDGDLLESEIQLLKPKPADRNSNYMFPKALSLKCLSEVAVLSEDSAEQLCC